MRAVYCPARRGDHDPDPRNRSLHFADHGGVYHRRTFGDEERHDLRTRVPYHGRDRTPRFFGIFGRLGQTARRDGGISFRIRPHRAGDRHRKTAFPGQQTRPRPVHGSRRCALLRRRNGVVLLRLHFPRRGDQPVRRALRLRVPLSSARVRETYRGGGDHLATEKNRKNLSSRKYAKNTL